MLLRTIALDYDGTIAHEGRLDPSVRDAIAYARGRGVTVLLVTGRILRELRKVAGDLRFVDAVVAENGAILHFPSSGRTTAMAPVIDTTVLEELKRRGVPFDAGRCLIDANADDGRRLLDVIRALEVPLVLAFNRNRVMVLPQGVSKATGLQQALTVMRLSARNAVALGDAENDYELLRAAEVGVAVGWGSPALRKAADVVLPGRGPADVAPYLRRLADDGTLPVADRARRQLLLGVTAAGDEFALAVRGRNVLVTGDTRSGKSWVAGLLCEQLILHGYCVCVIDPEGDYTSLEGLPGVAIIGDAEPPTPRDLLRALRYPDRSVVVDLSRLSHEDKVRYVRAVLPALTVLRRRIGLPHRILLDEAHYFLGRGDAPLLDLGLNGYTLVTFAPARLPAALLEASEVVVTTCLSSPADVAALRALCARCGNIADADWSAISHLEVGAAVALPLTAEAEGRLRRVAVAPRLTPHVRHRRKYVDVPVGEHRAFVFVRPSGPARRARTLREFVEELEILPPAILDGYARRGDFSRWIGDVFGDRALAKELRTLEDRQVRRAGPDAQAAIIEAIRARYDLFDAGAATTAQPTA